MALLKITRSSRDKNANVVKAVNTVALSTIYDGDEDVAADTSIVVLEDSNANPENTNMPLSLSTKPKYNNNSDAILLRPTPNVEPPHIHSYDNLALVYDERDEKSHVTWSEEQSRINNPTCLESEIRGKNQTVERQHMEVVSLSGKGSLDHIGQENTDSKMAGETIGGKGVPEARGWKEHGGEKRERQSFSMPQNSSKKLCKKSLSFPLLTSSLASSSKSTPILLSSRYLSSSNDATHNTQTEKQHVPTTSNTPTQNLNHPDGVWLNQFESDLKMSAKGNPYVTHDQIKNSLQARYSFFIDRLVQLVGDEADGQIEVAKLLEALTTLVNGSQTDKLRFLFDVYNTKGSGEIDRKDLQDFFLSIIDECNLHIDREIVQDMIETFFQTADENNDGTISFDELKTVFQRRPSITDNMTISSMFSSKASQRQAGPNLNDEMHQRNRFRYFSKKYIQNNLRKMVAVACYLFINLCLMAVAIYLYWNSSGWVQLARANGQALNFNCTLVLVLILRRTLTSLRNTPLRNVLPFDQHIWFHGQCGYVIVVMSAGHIVGHLGNCVSTADNSNMTVVDMLFTTQSGIGWVKESAYITGHILVVVLTVMVILSLPVIRRSGFFEVFYWSHKLYLVFWAILIIHASKFWMWFVVPGLIFIIELISRNYWFRMFSMGKTYIEQVSLLPSGVTHLVISRPHGFHFKPGDYVFIQVPAVAKYENHPFTISSAPENMDELWLHIRSAGHWTRSLNKFFTDYTSNDEENGGDIIDENVDLKSLAAKRRRASSIAWLNKKSLKALRVNDSIRKRVVSKKVKVLIHIDGPFGTASRHIFEQEHAILIGSGIGVTPFASILQSIVSRYKASCTQCPRCSHRWCHQTPASVMTLKKVDFIWINRDQRQFEWFASMLGRLEREQEVEGGLGGILEMHMFMTSLPAKTDMRGMGLQLALDLVHEDDNTDLLTGFKTRTQGGRPDFEKLFSKIKARSDGRRVKVFFCGSPLLGRTVKLYSAKYNFGFAHECF